MSEGRTLQELGVCLRSRREEKGVSTKDVSGKLHIRECYIVAIEEGDLENFPALVYARGFIRNYLAFLGETDLWEEYNLRCPQEEEPPISQSLSVPPRGFRKVAVGWLYTLIALLLLGGGGFLWFQRDLIFEAFHRNPKPTPVGKIVSGDVREISTPSPEKIKPAPVSGKISKNIAEVREEKTSKDVAIAPLSPKTKELEKSKESPVPSLKEEKNGGLSKDQPWLYEKDTPLENSEVAEEDRILMLTASDSCWIRVVKSKKVLFAGTLQGGQNRNFPLGEGQIDVRVGNAGAIAAKWWTREKQSLGGEGQVKNLMFKAGGGLGEF